VVSINFNVAANAAHVCYCVSPQTHALSGAAIANALSSEVESAGVSPSAAAIASVLRNGAGIWGVFQQEAGNARVFQNVVVSASASGNVGIASVPVGVYVPRQSARDWTVLGPIASVLIPAVVGFLAGPASVPVRGRPCYAREVSLLWRVLVSLRAQR